MWRSSRKSLSMMFTNEKKIFAKFCADKNLKRSQQREQVLEAFLKTEKHVTVQDLYDLMRKQGIEVGYTTVYRTLKLLSECGLASKVDFNDGKTRFEHKFAHQHHDHLVCLRCGKIREFHNPQIEKIQNEISETQGFIPRSHTLVIYGICKECQ